jgi:hypothetical protein
MERLKYLNNPGNENSEEINTKLFSSFKTSLIFIVIFCCLLLTPNFLFAGGIVYWTPNGVLLNNFTAGVGSPIDDTKGGAILFSIRPYGISQDSVVALRIDRNGNSFWGLQGKTLDNYAGWQGTIIGVSDGRGGAIAIWPRTPSQIYYYQRVDSLGNRMWGANAQRVTLSDSAQWEPVIASDGTKGAIVAWQEVRNYARGSDIYAQRIDSSGVLCWSDYGLAVCTADSHQEFPTITCDNTGNSVIAWIDKRSRSYDIYCQRLDINGVPAWPTNGIAVCSADSNQRLPGYGTVVVMATDTTIIVTWSDGRNGNGDIYAQKLRSDGSPLWTSQGVPVCDTINSQGSPQLVADGKGGGVFCWTDFRNGYRNIYAQRMNSEGIKLWTNQGIPVCNTDSTYYYQRIITDGRSGTIICWQDKRSGNWDIYAQHIDSLSNILWGTNGMPVCTEVNNQQNQEMIASDSGRVVICWTDYRSGSGRGYAQKIGDEIIGIKEQMHSSGNMMCNVKLAVYPNPFVNKTSIEFQIPDNKFQSIIKIYDCAGKLVKTFNFSNCRSLYNQLIWSSKDENNQKLPSGVYFCVLKADDYSKTVKTVLLR